MNLFKIANEYQKALDDLMSNDDLTEEVIKDTLEGLSGIFEDNVLNVVNHIKNTEYEIVGVKAAIDDFKIKKQRLEKHIESCKNYILNSMSLAEKKEVSSTDKSLYTFKVSTRINPPALDIIDEKLIPEKYYKTEVKKSIDNNFVKSDLKEGVDVPGAQLIQGMSLIIK
jgi:hypothetical protein